MDSSDILVWSQLAVRWVHIFAAILWIGQTYLFNWFEKSFVSDANTPPNVVGNLWMVHGGGFYLVEKQKQPEIMPRTLHWFKWESAITWLSGVVLIVITYYLGAGGGLLVEPEQSYNTAAMVGVGVVLASWLVYDLLVQSPLGKHDAVIAVIGFLALVGLSFGLKKVMSPRAAYIHVGFVIGTIMAANVWMRILPSQTRMLAAAKEGKKPDASLSARGPQRSKHNTFLVVPLVFLMLSNHYPSTFGNDYSWVILGVAILIGWTAARIMRGTRPSEGKAAEAAPAAKEG
jgi:uncharacterized membrane protein